MHVLFGFAHGQTTDRITVETDLQQPLEGDIPQIFVDRALDDAEQGILVAQRIKLVAGALAQRRDISIDLRASS